MFEMLLIIALFTSFYLDAGQVDQSITSINQFKVSATNQLEIINKNGIWVLAPVQAKDTKSLKVKTKTKAKAKAKNTKSLKTKPQPLTEFIVLPNGAKIQKGL